MSAHARPKRKDGTNPKNHFNGTEKIRMKITSGMMSASALASLAMAAALALGGAQAAPAKKAPFSLLYTFTNGNDGAQPRANLVADKAGNLYGTTWLAGADSYGTVFRLAPDGTETTLHTFTGGKDGALPYQGMVVD